MSSSGTSELGGTPVKGEASLLFDSCLARLGRRPTARPNWGTGVTFPNRLMSGTEPDAS